jgi:pimeloyl-ACP methyl ester carboxylesterase
MDTPLVFIHGSGDSGRIWRLQVEHFGKERAFAIDLPGHGERADTLPAEITVEDYARAVHEVITSGLRLQRPIIAGHSLGGAIALQMGLEYGEELGGLILIGTGARLRVSPVILQEARDAPDLAREHTNALCLLPEHVPTIGAQILREQVKTKPGILYRDLLACDTFDVISRLHEITLPTLVICGSEDLMTPPKYSTFLHAHLSGVEGGARLHIFPEAGHYVMWEQPEMVNQAIKEWLQEESAQRSPLDSQ